MTITSDYGHRETIREAGLRSLTVGRQYRLGDRVVVCTAINPKRGYVRLTDSESGRVEKRAGGVAIGLQPAD